MSQLITADNVKGLSEAELVALARYYDQRCWSASTAEYAAKGSDWEDHIDIIEAELEARGVQR